MKFATSARSVAMALLLACASCARDRDPPVDEPPTSNPPPASTIVHPEGAPFSIELPDGLETRAVGGPLGFAGVIASGEEGVVAIMWLDHSREGATLPPETMRALAGAVLAGMTDPKPAEARPVTRPGAKSGFGFSFVSGEGGVLAGYLEAYQLEGWIVTVLVGGTAGRALAPGGAAANHLFERIRLDAQAVTPAPDPQPSGS